MLCVDSLATGKIRSIGHLMENPHFRFLLHDVRLPLDVEVNEIYNLACPASPAYYLADPVHTLETAVLGSMNILRLAMRTDARILQASTSEIYGDPVAHPQPEGYSGNVDPVGPRACYAEGKRCAETMFMSYSRVYGLDARIVRIFNTYGPRMNPSDGRVVPSFIVQALRNEPVTVYGDGSQTRSFCYIDDMVRGIVAMMRMPTGYTGPVNLGGQTELRIRDLAEMIVHLTGSSSQIAYSPSPKDDPSRRQPDIQKALDELHWQPRITIEDGLQRTIAHFRPSVS